MRIHRAPLISAFAIAAMSIGAGVVHAEPAPANAGVSYEVVQSADGRSIETTLGNGIFRLSPAGNAVDIVNAAGTTVDSLPLAYSLRGNAFPIAAAIDPAGSTLTLTPETTPVALQNIDARGDAYDNMVRQWGLGWSNDGGVRAGIGTAIGVVVGCILVLIAACIPGAVLGGFIGAAIGVGAANPDFLPSVNGFLATF
jgi:hypothetical protein